MNHLDYADDLWLEELEPEPHPFTNYKIAIAEWRSLLEALGEDDGSSGRNRMLLVQLFSIVEAYLSDAVISLVHRDADALRAIVRWHPDLKAEKVALTSIAENPNLVRDFVVSKLRRTQFHRFEHVNGLIKAAIEHQLLPQNKDDRDLVLSAAKTRHVCVHRNGRELDGTLVSSISNLFLAELATHFGQMVSGLNERISAREESRRFSLLDVPWAD